MLNCFDITGKVALITGGNRGLGRAFAEGLAESGANVYLVARNEKTLAETSEYLKKTHNILSEWAVADITNEVEVENAVVQCTKKFGRIDILVNNAATDRVNVPPEDTTLQQWRQVVDINLTGAYIVAKTVGNEMIKQKSGKIINIVSICGYIINTTVHAGSYDVSKHAVIALTRALAVEWAKYNINVNAIAPGYFMTDPNREACNTIPGLYDSIANLCPLKRWGEPKELAGAVVFLSSRASDFMQGSVMMIDGGTTIV